MGRRAFTKAVKVRAEQLAWLKENRGRYSIAGKLDEVINYYKHGNNEKTTGKARDKRHQANHPIEGASEWISPSNKTQEV